MGAHAGQSLELALADRFSAHSDDYHEQGDQGRGGRQNQAGRPTDRENHRENAEGNKDGQGQLGQVAGEKIVQGLHLFHKDAGQCAGLVPVGERRPGGGQVVEKLSANFGAYTGTGLEAGYFPRPGQDCPADNDQGEKR